MNRPRLRLKKPHWLRTVRMFEEIAGRSWRAAAPEWGGVERKDLRACIDRHMTNDEIAQVARVLIESLEAHICWLDERRKRAADIIHEIRRGNERSPYCQIERAVIFDESAPELTLDELLVGYPPILRAVWADLLAEEVPKLTEKTA